MFRSTLALVALLLPSCLFSQVNFISPDNGAHGASLPATCAAGDRFQLTSAAANQQWYVCTALNTWSLQSGGGTGGGVSSVGVTLPASVFSVTGSPVTSSGNIAGSFINQNANVVFAGPSTGSPAAPSFRSLVITDLPTLASTFLSDSSNLMRLNASNSVTGSVVPSGGGTVNANQINGGTVPASAACLGSNSSAQPISVSCGTGGGTGNFPTASISGATATLFANCSSGTPCNVSKGGTLVDQIVTQNALTAPASGSGTVYVYWTSSGCGIISPVSITGTGAGQCAVASTTGSGFPNTSTAIISSLVYSSGAWTAANNFQPVASNSPVIIPGTGLTGTYAAGTLTLNASAVSNVNVPTLASMTEIGYTGGTGSPTAATLSDGSWLLKQSATSGDQWATQIMSITGSTPYTYMVGLIPASAVIATPGTGEFALDGIMLRQSSTGAFVGADFFNGNNGAPGRRSLHGTQPATGGGSGFSQTSFGTVWGNGPTYFAIQNDGANFNYKQCFTSDPNSCVTFFSETVASVGITPDQVGVFLDSPGTTIANSANIFYFAKVQ